MLYDDCDSQNPTLYWKLWETPFYMLLTHWGRVMHIYVSKLTSIGSDNGLSPGWRQAIIWTNAAIFLIGTLGTNFSEILIKIQIFSFMKMHLKISSVKWRPFCPEGDELMHWTTWGVMAVIFRTYHFSGISGNSLWHMSISLLSTWFVMAVIFTTWYLSGSLWRLPLKLTTTNMYITRAKFESQSAVKSSGLNAH